jgi:hypothetical protein
MKNTNFLTILVSLFLIIAATAIVYSNSLNGPFLFDDYHNIIGNKNMQVTDLSFESLKKANKLPAITVIHPWPVPVPLNPMSGAITC